VAEAMISLVLADAFLEKFGGDSINEVTRHLSASTTLSRSRLNNPSSNRTG
jgi:hypothetical protein